MVTIVSKALNLLLRGGFDLVTQSIVSGQGCQAEESFSPLLPVAGGWTVTQGRRGRRGGDSSASCC